MREDVLVIVEKNRQFRRKKTRMLKMLYNTKKNVLFKIVSFEFNNYGLPTSNR